MTTEQIEHPITRPESDFRHWIEISKISDKVFRAEEKDSKPVFNESKYDYRLEDGEIVFEGGSKSCSGAGKSRSTSPSDELNEKIKDLIRDRFISTED